MTPEQTSMSLIDLRLAITLGVPALIAVVGWIVGHWLNSRRELRNRRREARLKGLETAYKCLAMAAVRDWTEEHKLEFEKFVAEIQLYGTPRQVDLMTKLVEAFARQEKSISFDSLLEDLRDALRAELRMEPVKGPIWWYRFKLPEWKIQERAQQSASADGPAAASRQQGRG
jgi:hypothetical protein